MVGGGTFEVVAGLSLVVVVGWESWVAVVDGKVWAVAVGEASQGVGTLLRVVSVECCWQIGH